MPLKAGHGSTDQLMPGSQRGPENRSRESVRLHFTKGKTEVRSAMSHSMQNVEEAKERGEGGNGEEEGGERWARKMKQKAKEEGRVVEERESWKHLPEIRPITVSKMAFIRDKALRIWTA